jgi:hypothetical protein
MPAPGNSGVIVGEDGLARPPWASADALLRGYYDNEWACSPSWKLWALSTPTSARMAPYL